MDVGNYLEQYLLKHATKANAKDPFYLKSAIVMVNYKFREGIYFWSYFEEHGIEAAF